MSRENMDSVRRFAVHSGSVGIWRLGQNGFLFKTASGTTLSVDAYLTDSCSSIGKEMSIDLSRQAPVFIEPEESEFRRHRQRRRRLSARPTLVW
ncbi:MAG: hypothetical protein MOB07_31180 [Acidobacteria bacterium]|nr:hypothetical protein [Acidobacteriota bacterium]